MTHENAPESTESDAGPESGPVSDGEAQDAREARYAEAIRSASIATGYLQSHDLARAVMAVADAELAPLRARVAELEAEVERLTRWKAEATEVTLGLQDLGKALNLPLGTRITGTAAAKAAETMRARLRAVEALADAADRGTVDSESFPSELRAALAAAGPAVSDGEGATSEAAILSGVVLSAAGGIAATAAAASEQANVAKSLAAECQPRPQSDYDRARHAVAELRTKAGFVLGDVIATLVLDSGVVVPASPVVAPSATDEGGA